MNARELIAKLQAIVDAGEVDADLPVVTEGCDCFEHASDVVVSDVDHARGERRKTIVIERVK